MGVAEVVKVRVEPLHVGRHCGSDLVIRAKIKTIPGAVIIVGAKIFAADVGHIGSIECRPGILARLQVVDTAVGTIPGSTEQESEFFVSTPAMPEGTIEPAAPEAILERV